VQYISSSNSEFDGIYSMLIGINKEFNSFTLGADYSYTVYSNNFLDTTQQISPHVAFSFGDYKSLMGTYHINLVYDYISTDAKVQSIKSDYSASSISITQTKGSFQNFFKYLYGDNIFLVSSAGLSIQNFHEVVQDSLSFSSKYNFSPYTSIRLSFIRKNYKDLGINSNLDSKSENILAFLYYKF
jgi:hypothetical protein